MQVQNTTDTPRSVSERIIDFFSKNGVPLTREQSLLADRAVSDALYLEPATQESLFDFIPTHQMAH